MIFEPLPGGYVHLSRQSRLRFTRLAGAVARRFDLSYEEFMSVTTIAGISFDEHEYDKRGDVLYLSVGAPRTPSKTIATPEGHAVDYDESGAVIGMVLVNVRFLLDRDGAITVTIPPDRVLPAKIEPALVAA
jgi:uncharacterized protein YuzE